MNTENTTTPATPATPATTPAEVRAVALQGLRAVCNRSTQLPPSMILAAFEFAAMALGRDHPPIRAALRTLAEDHEPGALSSIGTRTAQYWALQIVADAGHATMAKRPQRRADRAIAHDRPLEPGSGGAVASTPTDPQGFGDAVEGILSDL